jgi:hypothetical protein
VRLLPLRSLRSGERWGGGCDGGVELRCRRGWWRFDYEGHRGGRNKRATANWLQAHGPWWVATVPVAALI